MKVLATTKGLVLIFSSLQEIKGVADQLYGQVEWIETEKVKPPYLYAQFDDRIPAEEMGKLLDEVKKE